MRVPYYRIFLFCDEHYLKLIEIIKSKKTGFEPDPSYALNFQLRTYLSNFFHCNLPVHSLIHILGVIFCVSGLFESPPLEIIYAKL